MEAEKYTVQNLYDDLSIEFNDEIIKGRSFGLTTGLDRVIPYLSKLEKLAGKKIVPIDIGKGISFNNEGDGLKIANGLEDLHSVLLSADTHFEDTVYLYSVFVTEPFFDYSARDLQQGSRLLPYKFSDSFRPFRSILVDIDVERMWDLRDDDPLIIAGDKLQNFIPKSPNKKDKFKGAIISDFLEKLDYLFDMDKSDVVKNDVHDVEKTGRLILRVAPNCVYIDRSKSGEKNDIIYKEKGKKCLKPDTANQG